jgi:hypothetical protein
MCADRLKGQEVTVNVLSTFGGLETSFADVGSVDFNFDQDILSEGYLGQTTEQKDDVHKGVSGSIKFHSRTADTIGLIQRIMEVSKGRLPGEEFQIVISLYFPLGGTRRIVVANAKFGTIPVSVSARDAFVEFSLEFAADEVTVVPV